MSANDLRSREPRAEQRLRFQISNARVYPLLIAIGYMVLTFLYYLFGPLPWPSIARFQIIVILVTSWTALAVGYSLAMRRKVFGFASPEGSVDLSRLVIAGALLNAITFPIALFGFTGSAIGDISFDIASQGDVYTERYQFLVTGGAGNIQFLASLTRAFAAPAIFGGLILGSWKFSSLRSFDKALLAASAFLQIAFSFARGTDKEILDLFVFMSLALVSKNGVNWPRLARNAVLVLVVAGLVLTLFVERREARKGELTACFERVGLCADEDDSLIASLGGDATLFAATEIAIYTTQGYHGFALAQDLDFQSSYGLGHAPALARTIETTTGFSVQERVFPNKLAEKGWDPRFAWSSLYTFIGNDVSMPLIPLVMLPLGWVFARSWQHARLDDDSAYVIFSLLVLLFFYSPANNQTAVSMEPWLVVVYWSYRWWKSARSRRGIAAPSS